MAIYNNIASTVSNGSNPKAFLVIVSDYETKEVYDIRIVDTLVYAGPYLLQVIAEADSREELKRLIFFPIV